MPPFGRLFGAAWLAAGLLLAQPRQVGALDPTRALTQYAMNHWLAENGLPQSSVYAICQTRDGYLWLGTEEGLARFDGVAFTVFDKRTVPELHSNHILTLYEDRRGSLWIGTKDGGLTRLAGGRFTTFTTVDGLPSNTVWTVTEDRSGVLWAGTRRGGLARLDGARFRAFGRRDGLASDTVITLLADPDGSLWVGTAQGLQRWRGDGPQDFAQSAAIPRGPVQALLYSRDGSLWAGTVGHGLLRLHDGASEGYSIAQGLPSDTIDVHTLLEDRNGNLWVGTDRGLARWREPKFEVLPQGQPLADTGVLALHEDREGSLWVGTDDSGMVRLKDGKLTAFGANEGLANEIVHTVFEDHDRAMWIGTHGGGLSRVQGTSVSRRDGGEPSTEIVWSLASGAQGELLVGLDRGLARLDGRRLSLLADPQHLIRGRVRAIYLDRAGTLWIGNDVNGLLALRGGEVTDLHRKLGLPLAQVLAILEDRAGDLWIGTDSAGLLRLRGDRFVAFTTRDGLSSNTIMALHEDGHGALWIGTQNGGLLRFADGRFKAVTSADGLPDDSVFAILEDGRENLWMSSNRGIFRARRRDLEGFARGELRRVPVDAYGKGDGMPSEECNGGAQPAAWKTHDGRLWFATMKGAVVIDPEHVAHNDLPPPVAVEGMLADHHALALDGALRLPAGTHSLEVHYTGLSLLAPERVAFRYMVEGFDNGWVEAGSRRVAYYTNLPPGHYRFRVLACNNDGVWNTTGAELGFAIAPYFYQTTWFYAVCGLASLGAAAAAYRLRVGQIHSRFAAVLAERNRMARELHDTLAQGLTGVGLQIGAAAKHLSADVDLSKAHLDRANQLVRQTQTELRGSVWALRATALADGDLAEALRANADQLTAGTGIETRLAVHGKPRRLAERIEGELLRIGQEAITNSVKHGQGRRLWIQVRYAPRCVLLSVRDDGRGFETNAPAHGRGGFGLLGAHERAARLGGRLRIRSQPGAGARVSVVVPTA